MTYSLGPPSHLREQMMRGFLLAALAATAFAATLTIEAPEANAVVYCVEGIYRAGCVARPFVVAPTVRGVARRTARRTTRRVVRRSDMNLKHDIALIGHLDNGLGFYRFTFALAQRSQRIDCHFDASFLKNAFPSADYLAVKKQYRGNSIAH